MGNVIDEVVDEVTNWVNNLPSWARGELYSVFLDEEEIVQFKRTIATLDVHKGLDNMLTDLPEMVRWKRVIQNWDFALAADKLITDVPEVVRFVRDIKPDDIESVLVDINGLMIELPQMSIKLADQTLYKLLERVGTEIQNLADTLDTCLDKIKDIAKDLGVLDKQSNLGDNLDIKDTLLQELATFLIPMKSQIEFVCNGKAEELIKIFIQMMAEGFGIVVPPPSTNTQECNSNGFCKPNEAVYPYGSFYKLLTFPLTLDLNTFDSIPPVISDIKTYTDSNAYAQLKFIVSILNEIEYWADNICEVFRECKDPFNIAGCAAMAICTATIKPIGTLVHVVEHLLDVADIHDGMIQAMQVDTIFNDRKTIINNQFVISNKLSGIESYLGMTPKKFVKLDPSNMNVDGVSVIMDPYNSGTGLVQIVNNEWVITGNNNEFQMEISLSNKFGFSDKYKSILQFTIYGTGGTINLDPVISFSVDSNEYWSSLLMMDNDNKNRIIICDTSDNPTEKLLTGNVKAKVQSVSKALSDSVLDGSWGYWKPRSASSSDDNAWPIIYKIVNDPILNEMFVSITNPKRLNTQKCGFGQAFTADKGLQIYIGIDAGQTLKIKQFDVVLELEESFNIKTSSSSSVHEVHVHGVNLKDVPLQMILIIGFIFIIFVGICNLSIYQIFKLKYNTGHVNYKTVNYDESETEIES
eukprot:380753_1